MAAMIKERNVGILDTRQATKPSAEYRGPSLSGLGFRV